MRLSWRALAIVPALWLAPAIARADWLPAGNRIGDGAGRDQDFVVTTVGADRVIVAWTREVSPGYTEVRAQMWTSDGNVVSGWPTDGALLAAAASRNTFVSVADDGAGGAFVAWVHYAQEANAHLQHVTADGSLAAGWPTVGLVLGLTIPWGPPALAPDGAGGVLLGRFEITGAYDLRAVVHRIAAAGVPTAGWPVGGLAIPNAAALGLAVDPAGHVFLGVSEFDPNNHSALGMRLWRMDGNGAPDPVWPQGGVLLADSKYHSDLRLFPDGVGGVFVSSYPVIFCAEHCGPFPTYYASRVLGDGSPDGRWIPGPAGYSVAPDGIGGMLFGMVVDGRPDALRLNGAGAPAPGWAAGGNRAMSEVVYPWGIMVTGDGRGGALVVWQDRRTGHRRLYASRLDASGRIAPGWPATGSFLGNGSDYASPVALVTVNEDLALTLWTDWTLGTGFLSALRPGEPGPFAELGPVDDEVGFGIVRTAPNPARGPIVATVELPNEGSARLDLVDAAGRVLQSRNYSFPRQAGGVVRFNQDGALRSGVYWLRLVQGARVASKKVIVLE